LSPKEKEWLDRFTSEYIITNFKHRGDKIITDEEEKKALYRDNNRRNTDIFSMSKANGKLTFGVKTSGEKTSSTKSKHGPRRETADSLGHDDFEDYLLTLITLKKIKLDDI